MSSPKTRMIKVLREIVEKDVVAPGDVAGSTGLPRYVVLAMFQCFEALGVVARIYSKGSHKLYSATPLAQKLLEALEAGSEQPLYFLSALVSGGKQEEQVSVDAA